jgi:hypothetical protein
VAAPFLILLGGLGGFLVVPMNALLQHRGHNLMGAGRSIAVQNFNEQACILILGAFYSAVTGLGLSAFGAITAFGHRGGRLHVASSSAGTGTTSPSTPKRSSISSPSHAATSIIEPTPRLRRPRAAYAAN